MLYGEDDAEADGKGDECVGSGSGGGKQGKNGNGQVEGDHQGDALGIVYNDDSSVFTTTTYTTINNIAAACSSTYSTSKSNPPLSISAATSSSKCTEGIIVSRQSQLLVDESERWISALSTRSQQRLVLAISGAETPAEELRLIVSSAKADVTKGRALVRRAFLDAHAQFLSAQTTSVFRVDRS